MAYLRRSGVWCARVRFDDRQRYLGDYPTKEEAERVEAAFRRTHCLGNGSVADAKRIAIDRCNLFNNMERWPQNRGKIPPRKRTQ